MKPFFQNARIVGDGIDPEAYHRSDAKRGEHGLAIGRSTLMEFAKCPSRWIRGYQSKDTDSTDWGQLMDTLALSPSAFGERYAVTPDVYPCEPTKSDPRTEKPWNWNAGFCKEWKQNQGSKSCLTPKELGDAQEAIGVLLSNGPVLELIECSKRQVFVVGEYVDAQTGLVIPVKALLDLVPDKSSRDFGPCLADFKTSFTADGQRWARISFERGYHVQAAFHSDLFNAATGEHRETWLNVIQENFPPYEVANPIPMLSLEFLALGRVQYQQALRDYCRCLMSGEWPSYPPTQTVISPFQVVEPEPWMVSVKNAFRETFPSIAPITTDLARVEECDFTP